MFSNLEKITITLVTLSLMLATASSGHDGKTVLIAQPSMAGSIGSSTMMRDDDSIAEKCTCRVPTSYRPDSAELEKEN
ncbi:hypothetical protein [Floridanema aerugineum]|uniref:Secreted protein n=1 Tax=Floridaenema aerugineum BLCC-F46 TaxID=3153654 RepID=A0ABV4X3A5_9CYAN